jgi:hypothetical protein
LRSSYNQCYLIGEAHPFVVPHNGKVLGRRPPVCNDRPNFCCGSTVDASIPGRGNSKVFQSFVIAIGTDSIGRLMGSGGARNETKG